MSTAQADAAVSEIARPKAPRIRTQFASTKKRTLTRRGVMWLGQTCNAECYFCYFLNRIADHEHPEHPFMSLEKAKEICRTMREFYGDTSVDIQGGEPTIHPDILELIRYCKEIGLHPTLITNGLSLGRPGALEKFRDAGVRDFLVSLHGLGEVHDEVVGRKNASTKIIAAIERMVALDMPFRFNCTMSKPVVPLLPDIAHKAVEFGANAVNYIAFNPFGDQQTGLRNATNVPRYSEIRPKLTEAMDILDEAGIECNVRYLPICMGEPRHRKNFFNFQQLSYDHHEWDLQAWMWTMMQPQMMRDGGVVPAFKLGPYASGIYRGDGHAIRDRYHANPTKGWVKFKTQHAICEVEQLLRGKAAVLRDEAKRRAEIDCQYKYDSACAKCSARNICDGFHGDYAEFFGTQEAVAITDIAPVDDPTYYIRDQEKIVEVEDKAWAL